MPFCLFSSRRSRLPGEVPHLPILIGSRCCATSRCMSSTSPWTSSWTSRSGHSIECNGGRGASWTFGRR
eukprot:4656282-Pyramimonas_sp.AAC.1